jgi:hypothetical protein
MRQILEDVHKMMVGPGHLRFLVQPAVAVLLGLRDGRIDSHAGLRPFGVELRAKQGREQWAHLKQALRRVVVPLCLAILLSLIFQFVIRGRSRLIPALAFASMLVALPYLIARGIANRIDSFWHRTHPRRASRSA